MAPFALRACALLALPALLGALKVEDTLVEMDFFQQSFPSNRTSGEFLLEFNHEEILHVDWDKKQNSWRLPEFKEFTGFEVQGALANIAVMRNNMEVLMVRSNRSRAENAPPTASVYPENPVDIGDPNVLICFVDKFSPPVLSITWLKNGQEVSSGVQETDFYPSADAAFRKFSYLSFVPQEGDVYICQVDHWGLEKPHNERWEVNVVIIPETFENVVCIVGLVVGIVGIITGTTLFLKGLRMRNGPRRRGFI